MSLKHLLKKVRQRSQKVSRDESPEKDAVKSPEQVKAVIQQKDGTAVVLERKVAQ